MYPGCHRIATCRLEHVILEGKLHTRVDIGEYERAVTGRGNRVLRPASFSIFSSPRDGGRPVSISAAPPLQ